MENILLGYGLKIENINIFKPLHIARLFNIQSDEISMEELEEMDDEDVLDILTYSEGVTLQSILDKVAEQSSIVQNKYNGANHCLVFSPLYSWEVTDQLKRLQPSDIEDEITFILQPLLKEDVPVEALKHHYGHIYYENI